MNNRILAIIAGCLIALYVIPSIKSLYKKTSVQTVFFNKKYEDQLSEIQITDTMHTISLLRTDDSVWHIEYESYMLPVDQKHMRAFLDRLEIKRKMSKISDISSGYYFPSSNTMTIKYKIADNEYKKVYFGDYSFAMETKYIKTDDREAVYEAKTDDVDVFMDSDVNSWVDPCIIPQNAAGTITENDILKIHINDKLFVNDDKAFPDKTRKLLELRHGDIIIPSGHDLLLDSFSIELENGGVINLNIYESQTKYILCTVKTSKSASFSDYSYAAKISDWTYDKLKNLF